MHSSSSSRAWLQIHFCVLLWGFTAILGKLIALSAPTLVWWRMLIVSVTLFCVPRVWRSLSLLSLKSIAIYAGIGALVAAHWLAFYTSIKLSNASVAATCIATSTIFMAFIEPLFARKRVDIRELMLGVAVIPAVALVVGGTPTQMHLGIFIGIIAAALVAVFGSLNKRFTEHADPLTITCIEMSAGFVFLTLFYPMFADTTIFALPNRRDTILLLILSLACTLLPFALSLVALRKLSAFGAQLAVNLEPVYAIVLAIPLLDEQRELNAQFYFGVIAILIVVFIYPLFNRTRNAAT